MWNSRVTETLLCYFGNTELSVANYIYIKKKDRHTCY